MVRFYTWFVSTDDRLLVPILVAVILFGALGAWLARRESRLPTEGEPT